jgi:lysyl-tRNA synthetase class I
LGRGGVTPPAVQRGDTEWYHKSVGANAGGGVAGLKHVGRWREVVSAPVCATEVKPRFRGFLS